MFNCSGCFLLTVFSRRIVIFIYKVLASHKDTASLKKNLDESRVPRNPKIKFPLCCIVLLISNEAKTKMEINVASFV